MYLALLDMMYLPLASIMHALRAHLRRLFGAEKPRWGPRNILKIFWGVGGFNSRGYASIHAIFDCNSPTRFTPFASMMYSLREHDVLAVGVFDEVP